METLCKNSVCSKVMYLWFILLNLIASCHSITITGSSQQKSTFTSIWNAPTELCKKNFDVEVDVSIFQIVGSTIKSATNQKITLFYNDRLGYYPSINEITGESINGGIPQMTNMDLHLKKAEEDILYYIPSVKQSGLAVIDWEDWRPIWMRNWASKVIYKTKSIDFAKQQDQTLTEQEATKIAKKQFEDSAQNLMLKTIKLGKFLRPNYLWGFYLYPNCHNTDYKENLNYTGKCPKIEIFRNDELHWLWKESTALFINIYLETELKSSNNAALYCRDQIQEAFRVSSFSNYSLPIYVYTRPVFTDHPDEFLSQIDLINTIGESAALGVDGFIMWGDIRNMTGSKEACTDLNNYILNILNPYIINITLASKLCSLALCQNKGVCRRKQWNTNSYLHLNANNMVIEKSKVLDGNRPPFLQADLAAQHKSARPPLPIGHAALSGSYNISKDEREAIEELASWNDVLIKGSDKGGKLVWGLEKMSLGIRGGDIVDTLLREES
ncbi:hyaluronidase-5-like [Rhinophrynus dorsalis]